MAKKRFYGSDMSGLNAERNREARDFSMLSEDHSAIANMPKEIKYHEWPKANMYANSDLDDTIRGVDKQMNEDGSQMARHKAKSKY